MTALGLSPVSGTLPNLQLVDVWLVMSALGAYQLYLQLQSQGNQRYEEGLVKSIQYLIGVPTLIYLLLFMSDPDLLTFAFITVVKPANDFGLIAFNLSGILILASHLALGRFWSGDLETKPDHELICAGPYRWVRHPLYSSYLLLSVGLFAMSGNWLVGMSMLAYFIAVAARTSKEEAMLVEKLGERYIAYQRRTGRFLPRLHRLGHS